MTSLDSTPAVCTVDSVLFYYANIREGVSFSTPPLALFDSPPQALSMFATYQINTNETSSSLARNYAIWQIFSDFAAERSKTIIESVSTPAVAIDMLNIARAFGFNKVNYWGIS